MAAWCKSLETDPLVPLLSFDDERLHYFVRRDLLAEPVGPVEVLWELPSAQKLPRKQQAEGSWCYPGRSRECFPETNYDLLQTFKVLGELVEKHGLVRAQPGRRRPVADRLRAEETKGTEQKRERDDALGEPGRVSGL